MKTRLLPFVFGALALLQPAPVLQAGTTLGDALHATNLVWETGGTRNVGWVYEQDVSGGGASFDGIAAAKSGHVYDNGETWLQTTVVGPGTASFWWQAYSEPNKDWLDSIPMPPGKGEFADPEPCIPARRVAGVRAAQHQAGIVRPAGLPLNPAQLGPHLTRRAPPHIGPPSPPGIPGAAFRTSTCKTIRTCPDCRKLCRG